MLYSRGRSIFEFIARRKRKREKKRKKEFSKLLVRNFSILLTGVAHLFYSNARQSSIRLVDKRQLTRNHCQQSSGSRVVRIRSTINARYSRLLVHRFDEASNRRNRVYTALGDEFLRFPKLCWLDWLSLILDPPRRGKWRRREEGAGREAGRDDFSSVNRITGSRFFFFFTWSCDFSGRSASRRLFGAHSGASDDLASRDETRRLSSTFIRGCPSANTTKFSRRRR